MGARLFLYGFHNFNGTSAEEYRDQRCRPHLPKALLTGQRHGFGCLDASIALCTLEASEEGGRGVAEGCRILKSLSKRGCLMGVFAK